ncbi:MAG: putative aminopeptidase [Anaerolineales bacterium]|nr:putative aminopeptidase [Anaerolineales bacterium]
MRKLRNSIADVPGIEVGHAQNEQALTGCTVVLCRKGAVAGVDVRGGAPGTRETDLLNPGNLVQQVHAILLSGGSAFGLDAASGVMRWLEEKKIGYQTRNGIVPIVPAAILYDLDLGDSKIRPDAKMGYQACVNASEDETAEGVVGAGTGSSVGKMLGMSQAMKSGVGGASVHLGKGIVVGAIAAVNALGDVYDPQTGEFVAGIRSEKKTLGSLRSLTLKRAPKRNTVIGVVAVNANFTKAETTRLAQMAHDGLARAIRPAHTQYDGDTIFALATGGKKVDLSLVGAYAAEVFAEAIVRAVKASVSAGGLPGLAGHVRRSK